jgi:uncharacterized protein YkwD
VIATEELVRRYKDEGYRFATVGEMLAAAKTGVAAAR